MIAKSVLYPISEELFCILVGKINITAPHTPGQKSPVDVLNVVLKILLTLAKGWVFRFIDISGQGALCWVETQIVPYNYPDVVVFKTLGSVDAPNLLESLWAVSPFIPFHIPFGRACDFPMSLPWQSEISNLNVIYEIALVV